MTDYSVAYLTFEKVAKERQLTYPLPVLDILHSYGIKVISYSRIAEMLDLSIEEVIDIGNSDFGFSLKNKTTKECIIFYNEKQSIETIRFTLMHELGHYLMNHDIESNVNENLANCFARNILSPVQIFTDLHFTECYPYSVYYIEDYFGISNKAALARISFLENDLYYINKLNIRPNLIYTSIFDMHSDIEDTNFSLLLKSYESSY